MWSDDQERVGREDPNWSHASNGEGLSGPQNEVDEDAEDNSEGCVEPEEDQNSFVEPPSNRTEAVLRDVDENRAEGDSDCGDEEGFCRMREGRFEHIRVEGKTSDDHGGQQNE